MLAATCTGAENRRRAPLSKPARCVRPHAAGAEARCEPAQRSGMRFVPSPQVTDERMSDDAFSAIAIVTAYVLTDDAVGMTDASTTRRPPTP